MLFGKRLEGMEASRLVMMEKPNEDRNRCWEGYEVLRRKFELDNEVGSVDRFKNKRQEMRRTGKPGRGIFEKHIEMV